MAKSNAYVSKVALSCALICSSSIAACSGFDWEEQRLVIDVFQRQGSDHSVEDTNGADANPTDPETEHDAGTVATPTPSFELCETSLLDQSYSNNGSFWIGESTTKHYVVNGGGYFAARSDGGGEVRYSKAIELSVRADGTLVDAGGRSVLGFGRDGDGERQCASALRAPIGCRQRATTRISQNVNLDPDTLTPPYFDPWQPWLSASTSTALLVYDSIGTSHWVNFYFNKVDVFLFSYQVTAQGGEVDGGTPGTEHLLGGGTLAFDTNGALLDAQTPDIVVDFIASSPGQTIVIDFGEDIANDGSNGSSGSTALTGPTYVASSEQDGHPAGTAVDVWVGARGEANLECSFGGSFVIGSLILARFPNERELSTGPDGTQRQTSGSGAPAFAPPGYPGRGFVE